MKTLQYTTTMKQFFNKADQLTENIEMGFYTKNQALSMLRSLRNEILDKFVPIPGSKNIIEEEDYGFGLILKSVEKSPTSYGSGFVISKDGYILTNAHVISNLDVWEENLRVGLTLADYLILEEEYYLGNIDRDTYDYYIYLNDYLYEYLEITPNNVRLRKQYLTEIERTRQKRKQ